MKKLALAIVVIAGLYWLGSREEPGASAPPDHRVAVESISCESQPGGMSGANVAIRNTGSTTLKFPQVSVRVGSEVKTHYLSPNTLRPDGIATAAAYNTAGGHDPCEVVAVTDTNGYPAIFE